MFFKKKVGKGVRGEGKTFSPFLLLFFSFPSLFLAVPCGLGFFSSKMPSPACARGWQREGRALCGALSDGVSWWVKDFWEPCGRAVLAPRVGMELLSSGARDPIPSWGCLASPAAAMPRGCGTGLGSRCRLWHVGWAPVVPRDRQPGPGDAREASAFLYPSRA